MRLARVGGGRIEVDSYESFGTHEAAYAKPSRELIAWPWLDRENRDVDRLDCVGLYSFLKSIVFTLK